LGNLEGSDSAQKLLILIPTDAESISIQLDIYRIGDWDYENDSIAMVIDSTSINLGHFNQAGHGEIGDITWWRSAVIGSPSSSQQVHHVSTKMPVSHFAERIDLKILGSLSSSKPNKFFGIDNVKIVANYECSCENVKTVSTENFENYPGDGGVALRTAGWINGKIDSDSQTTKFLGRYGVEDELPAIVLDVPPDAAVIAVHFDFYEIDEWKGEHLYLSVNGDKIDLGSYSSVNAELNGSGRSARGIIWTKTASPLVTLGFRDIKDQVHRMKLRVPQEISGTGQISLKFEADLTSSYENAAAGFDNFDISAEYNCGQADDSGMIPLVITSCEGSIEREFDSSHQCNAGYFGASNLEILQRGTETVKFRFSGHSLGDRIIDHITVWFLDPDAEDDAENFHQCWSSDSQRDLLAESQAFVAQCEDGYATISITAGDEDGGMQFSQGNLDVVEPYCVDGKERPDFNPNKRCFWEFVVPCTHCDSDTPARALETAVSEPSDSSDCRVRSRLEDVHPVQVDTCITPPLKEVIQIVSQDKESVTFSVVQQWKGCGAAQGSGKIGWIATDYVTTAGDLECDKKSNVSCGLSETYTAHCSEGMAVIDLYAYDGSIFSQSDGTNLVVPLACDGTGDESKRCHFRYVLGCEPSLCNNNSGNANRSAEAGRRLGGPGKN
jgi:hypothetical protein